MSPCRCWTRQTQGHGRQGTCQPDSDSAILLLLTTTTITTTPSPCPTGTKPSHSTTPLTCPPVQCPSTHSLAHSLSSPPSSPMHAPSAAGLSVPAGALLRCAKPRRFREALAEGMRRYGPAARDQRSGCTARLLTPAHAAHAHPRLLSRPSLESIPLSALPSSLHLSPLACINALSAKISLPPRERPPMPCHAPFHQHPTATMASRALAPLSAASPPSTQPHSYNVLLVATHVDCASTSTLHDSARPASSRPALSSPSCR